LFLRKEAGAHRQVSTRLDGKTACKHTKAEDNRQNDAQMRLELSFDGPEFVVLLAQFDGSTGGLGPEI
jgi:hypothetical protein